MTDNSPDFRLRHNVGQGVNFCFYLLGKGQLRLPALTRPALWLTPDSDPFADFARRFETARPEGVDGAQVDPLWRSWLREVAETCPDVAADALSAMPDLAARPAVRTEFQRFGRVQLNDFLERWHGVRLEMEGRVGAAVRAFDPSRILSRHAETLGVDYRQGRAVFEHHLLRVFSVSRFGMSFVVGGAYLERPERLASVVARETLHALVLQTGIWHRDEVRPLLDSLRRLLQGSFLQPQDAADEAVCTLVAVLEYEGEAAPLEHIEARLPHPAMRVMARALYEHRRLRRSQGFVQWIAAGLEQAGRVRRTS
jgi:hypothetical protein